MHQVFFEGVGRTRDGDVSLEKKEEEDTLYANISACGFHRDSTFRYTDIGRA